MRESDINYTREAFLHPWNLTFLIGALACAFGSSFLFGTLGSVPFNSILLFAAALELLALGYVPRQERFRRLIRSQRAAQKAKPPSQKELYISLSRQNQRRYFHLRDLEKNIEANYSKLSYASQGLLESHKNKIGGLLDSCLSLLSQKQRYDQYSRRTGEEELLQAITDLRLDMEDDTERVRAVKARRLRILEQRLDRFKKSLENMEIINAQVATIEDVIKYIHEQSMTLRNPEEITYQLNLLLNEVEETEASVGEMESLFAAGDSLLAGIDDEFLSESPERARLRESGR